MKQLIQSVETGELSVVDVPEPQLLDRGILVRTRASAVSAGTERMIAGFARKNLLQKARSRPDLVKQTIQKIRRNGLLDTIDAVRTRLGQPMTLGYSAAGEVIAVGAGVDGFRPGDRVACAGAGYAVHAEVISVPVNLAVRVPDDVPFEHAAFCTVGTIALHGIRLAGVRLGEVAAVIGLGLLGQLTLQMLKVAGCIVIGTDPDVRRAELARSLGIEGAFSDADEFAERIAAATGGRGADAVLVTADTPSDQPVELAGRVARDRGVVISVGAVGTRLPRKSYFEKELEFRVSRSYGPGRYDSDYEQKGQDYPYGFVRWTENRNMAAFVSMLESKSVDVAPLITHRFDIEDAGNAYDLILTASEPFLGVVLEYPSKPAQPGRVFREGVARPVDPVPGRQVSVGVLGAGLFANSTLLPVLAGTPGVRLTGVVSGSGVTARSAVDRFGFAYCATDEKEVLSDAAVNTVAILTRHHLHASQVQAALRAGKHVFVEKPLCLTAEELAEIEAAHRDAGGRLMVMVGFNRRFAPFIIKLRNALQGISDPLMLTCRVNAGFIPREHWIQDMRQGGGRLRGEACHFIDLLIHLASDRVVRVQTQELPDSGRYAHDNFQVTLRFANGSIGTVVYVANGSREFAKESIEVFGGGLAARLDDYRTLDLQRGAKSERVRSRFRQDKGHRGEWQAIAQHLTGGAPAPIPFDEVVHSTAATLAAYTSLLSGLPEDVTR